MWVFGVEKFPKRTSAAELIPLRWTGTVQPFYIFGSLPSGLQSKRSGFRS